MRRILFISAITMAAICAGCVNPEKTEMIAFAQGWKAVGPEYKAYIQADEKLTADQKANRQDTIALMDKAVAGFLAAQK